MPNAGCHKVLPTKDFVADNLEVSLLVIVDGDPDGAVFAEELAQEFEARVHQVEPSGVLEIVVVVLEGRAGVVGRVDVDALDLSGVEGQERA